MNLKRSIDDWCSNDDCQAFIGLTNEPQVFVVEVYKLCSFKGDDCTFNYSEIMSQEILINQDMPKNFGISDINLKTFESQED